MNEWTDPQPWTTTGLPEDRCPMCDCRIEAASTPGKASPHPGDVSVCISCTSVLVFNDDLRLREMSRDEFANLHPENKSEILLVQRGIRMLDRRNLKGNMRGIP